MSSIVRTLIMAKKRGFLPKDKGDGDKYSAKDLMKRRTREKEMSEGACAHGEQEMSEGARAAANLFQKRKQSGYWAERRAKIKIDAKLKYEKAMSEGARSHGEQELQHPTDSCPPSEN